MEPFYFFRFQLALLFLASLNFLSAQITVQHQGNADASVHIEIINPDSLTGDDYELTFACQNYYLDSNGVWQKIFSPDSISKSLSKISDISRSRLSGAAVWDDSTNTVNLIFILELNAAGCGWADGVSITFPENLVINSWKPIHGFYGYFNDYAQNLVNSAGTYDAAAHSITWGDSARSTNGTIQGTVYLEINVDLFALPQQIFYKIFDDGYGQNIVDADGELTIQEIGYGLKTENLWNLKNSTTNKFVLKDQIVIDGMDIFQGVAAENPIVDGFRIIVQGTYDPPIDFTSVVLIDTNGVESFVSRDSVGSWTDGWPRFGLAFISYGSGTNRISELIKDYEIRFTGEFYTSNWINKNNDTILVHYVKEGTGSMAWLDGARMYDLADHPMNPNPGSEEPFMVRIPFEVWNVDDNRQINIQIYDRKQFLNDPIPDFWAFNPHDRMYSHFINTAYKETPPLQADFDAMTWNLIWWQTPFVLGEKLTIKYTNPITSADVFSFSTKLEREEIPETYTLYQNYPNPFNSGTRIKYYLTSPNNVTLKIYNLLGQKIRTLVNEPMDAGFHFAHWDGTNALGQAAASGVYFYQLQTGNLHHSKKMILLR